MGQRVRLGALGKRCLLSLLVIEPGFIGHPACDSVTTRPELSRLRRRNSRGKIANWIYKTDWGGGAGRVRKGLDIRRTSDLQTVIHRNCTQLSARRTVLLETVAVCQPVKKFPEFYGTRGLVTSQQDPMPCPYPEAARSSPCIPIQFLQDSFQYYPPICA